MKLEELEDLETYLLSMDAIEEVLKRKFLVVKSRYAHWEKITQKVHFACINIVLAKSFYFYSLMKCLKQMINDLR
ncbi:7879_t:CDS:2, partial [Entrophospora sp. SA101]